MKINQYKTLLVLLLCVFTFSSEWVVAQCYMDRHNTSWNTGWVSCDSELNPNEVRGDGHWILYDLQYNYELGTTTFWNINDPDNLANGANEIIVDISDDGIEWSEWGSFYLPAAPGVSIYEGVDGPDLSESSAQYVLLTIESNHGGDCYGLSEMRLDVNGVVDAVTEIETNGCLSVSVYPNPFSENVNAKVTSDCPEAITYTIYDAMGRLIHSERLNNGMGTQRISYAGTDLAPGIYHFEVVQGESHSRTTIVRMER